MTERGLNADGNNVGWSAFTGSVHQPKEGHGARQCQKRARVAFDWRRRPLLISLPRWPELTDTDTAGDGPDCHGRVGRSGRIAGGIHFCRTR